MEPDSEAFTVIGLLSRPTDTQTVWREFRKWNWSKERVFSVADDPMKKVRWHRGFIFSCYLEVLSFHRWQLH